MAMLGQLGTMEHYTSPTMAGGFAGSPWALSFLKGITFISNTVALQTMLADRGLNSYADWLPLVITWTHC